jgi:anti-sigma regulatory factor (Ser/Thr protein kinase)
MPAGTIIRADSAAIRRMRQFVAAFTAGHGIHGDDEARICLVLEELLTNLLKYGYRDRPQPGFAEIQLELQGTALAIEFVDDGGPFDPFAQPPADLDQPLELRPAGGLGLNILRALTESASYRRSSGRNVLHLTRHVSLVGR